MTIELPSILDLDPEANQTVGALDGETLILDHEGRLLCLDDLAFEYDLEISVTCLDKHGRMSTATAHSFRIGEWTDEIYKITLSNGHIIRATKDQLFMGVNGEWLKASDLSFGTAINAVVYNPTLRHPFKTTHQVEHVHKTWTDSKLPTYSFEVKTHNNLLIAQPIRNESVSLVAAHSAVYR